LRTFGSKVKTTKADPKPANNMDITPNRTSLTSFSILRIIFFASGESLQ